MSTTPPLDNWLEPLDALATLTNSFVVTIRSQPRTRGRPGVEWHGSVEHTQSRERIFFIDYARLNGFIAARSETPLRPTWRTRLSRRWQATGLHHFLRRLQVAQPLKPAPPISG